MRVKIRLDTLTDCQKFVNKVSMLKGNIVLEDGSGFKINAKSLLGALAATEWINLWCVSDVDIYSHIKKFVIE